MSIPTKTLEEEERIRIKMMCDPNSVSDCGKSIRYGNWEDSVAVLFCKDGSQLVESNSFELKQEQGPFKPLPEEKISHFRGLDAKANYLAADRPDIQFPS